VVNINKADIFKYELRTKTIGARIKEERKRANITQSELAHLIADLIKPEDPDAKDIGQSVISNWEKGVALPTLNKIVCLSHIFQCDVGYLLGDYDERTRDHADACAITGLSQTVVDLLIRLKNSQSTYAPFRLKVINLLLESEIFWNNIIEHLQSAYLFLKNYNNAPDEEITGEMEKVRSVMGILNFCGTTQYAAIDGKTNADLQIQSAANAAQNLFRQIVHIESKEEQ